MDVAERLDWLAKHDNSVFPFHPAALFATGQCVASKRVCRGGRAVLIRREDKQRAAEWERAMTTMGGSLTHELIAFAHQFRHC